MCDKRALRILKAVCAAGFICLSSKPAFIEAAEVNQGQQSQVVVEQSQTAENIKKLKQQQGNSIAKGQIQSGQNNSNSPSANQVQFANVNAYEVQTGASTGPASMNQRQSIEVSQKQEQTSPHVSEHQTTEIGTSQEQTMSVENPSHMVQADITNATSIQYQVVTEDGTVIQKDMTHTYVFQYQIAAPK